MATTPPHPVLPPPPFVGEVKPVVAAPVVVGATDVEPVPDTWFTDFEADPAPESMIETEAVEPVAELRDDAPREETRVPTLPMTPPTRVDAPRPRRTTQLIAGGVAVLAAIVLVIRCAGGPANDVATRDDALARAGGHAQDPAEHPVDGSRGNATAHGEADARDAAAR
ncbi:MAG: hypothetical protein IAG13_09310, partial [Deltaproteobacteria bacterium]|nr:hypothetical protein [Nannocystaceae bacterium]